MRSRVTLAYILPISSSVCVRRFIHEAETHFENLAFALGQGGQHVKPSFFLQQAVARDVRRVFRGLVFDEIADADITFIANGA